MRWTKCRPDSPSRAAAVAALAGTALAGCAGHSAGASSSAAGALRTWASPGRRERCAPRVGPPPSAPEAGRCRDTGRECTALADEVLMLWAGVHGLLTLAAGPQLPLARRALLRLTDQMAGRAI